MSSADSHSNATAAPETTSEAGSKATAKATSRASPPVTASSRRQPKPPWLRVTLPGGQAYREVRQRLGQARLNTVCQEARCPNLGECWAHGTATIMLLGDVCTRGCRFCAVASGQPAPADPHEPQQVMETVRGLGLDHVVLTMVDRDDLPDGGARHLVDTVALLRQELPQVTVELLTGDHRGDRQALALIARSGARVLAHNLETVERLTPLTRDPRCGYRLSLDVLAAYRELAPSPTPATTSNNGSACLTKSSLMLGLGETEAELLEAMSDLRKAGVDLLTLGQYLQPTRHHLPVVEYVTPERFESLGQLALDMGFKDVAAGPLVRSSYKAGELLNKG